MAFFGYLFGTWYGLLAVIMLSIHVGAGFLGMATTFFRKVMPNIVGDVLGTTIGSIPLVVLSSCGFALIPAVFAIGAAGTTNVGAVTMIVFGTLQWWAWRIGILLLMRAAWNEFRSHYPSHTFWELVTLRFPWRN